MTSNTDQIISVGLVTALILFIIGEFISVVLGVKPLAMDFATNIGSGLIGYMGKVLIERMKDSDTNQPSADSSRGNSADKGHTAP